jgi:hypothetical protein
VGGIARGRVDDRFVECWLLTCGKRSERVSHKATDACFDLSGRIPSRSWFVHRRRRTGIHSVRPGVVVLHLKIDA